MSRIRAPWWKIVLLLMALGLGGSFLPITVPAQDTDNRLRPPSIGQDNNAEMWRAIRQGIQGKVSIPDKKAGVLVQSEGEEWR